MVRCDQCGYRGARVDISECPHHWVPCTYCAEDGLVHCGLLPPLECPICFGSKKDYRSEKQRAGDHP